MSSLESLSILKNKYPQYEDDINNLRSFHEKKLWHQLTIALWDFVKKPEFSQGTDLIPLKDTLIKDIETRVNPLTLVEILLCIVKQMSNPEEAIQFLEQTKNASNIKNNILAVLLCTTTLINIKLQTQPLADSKSLIEEAQDRLEAIDGVTPVHSRFYEMSSRYYMLLGDHALYYRDTLRYLGCLDVDTDLTQQQRHERAFSLSISAILGEGVYNFGELLAHPILNSLSETEHSWIRDVLFAFNSGNIAKFDALKPHWSQIVDLAAAEIKMRQKISLLCLMETAFKKPANDRNLTFNEIADEVRIQLCEVELLVMKALSLNLVKGSIDELEKTVHITWIQPRVLDKEQLGDMRGRIKGWKQAILQMENVMKEKANELIAFA